MQLSRRRTYIPEWGSFTGPDWKIEITEEIGQGSYQFPGNNPLTGTDPTGLGYGLEGEKNDDPADLSDGPKKSPNWWKTTWGGHLWRHQKPFHQMLSRWEKDTGIKIKIEKRECQTCKRGGAFIFHESPCEKHQGWWFWFEGMPGEERHKINGMTNFELDQLVLQHMREYEAMQANKLLDALVPFLGNLRGLISSGKMKHASMSGVYAIMLALESSAVVAKYFKGKRIVASVKNGKFQKWYDSISYEELEELYKNKQIRRAIERRLRYPGRMHEWLVVSQAPTFKRWGLKADDVYELRTQISKIRGINWAHGGKRSTTIHNQLTKLVTESKDYTTFKARLANWATYNLDEGLLGLPAGLRPKVSTEKLLTGKLRPAERARRIKALKKLNEMIE